MKINLIDFQNHGDERGELVVMEAGKQIPFTVKRVYYLFATSAGVRRGGHAHKRISQIAVPVKGFCRFHLDNGYEQEEVLLDNPYKGLLLESFIWREMYDFSEDCVLLLLASELFDETEYIRDYQEFLLHIETVN